MTLGKERMGKVGWELLLELAGSAPHHQPANRALHPGTFQDLGQGWGGASILEAQHPAAGCHWTLNVEVLPEYLPNRPPGQPVAAGGPMELLLKL